MRRKLLTINYFIIIVLAILIGNGILNPSKRPPAAASTPSISTPTSRDTSTITPTCTSTKKPTRTPRPTQTPTNTAFIPTFENTITPLSISPVVASPFALNQSNTESDLHRIGFFGTGFAQSFIWSPFGTQFAVETTRGVYLYNGITFTQTNFLDFNENESVLKMNPFSDYIAFSPDGNFLATLVPGRIIIWDLRTNREINELSWDKTTTYKLVFGPNGLVAAAGNDCRSYDSVSLWNSVTGEQLYVKNYDNGYWRTVSVDISPNGKTLAFFSDDEIELLDINTHQSSFLTIPYHLPSGDLVFSSDGDRLFTTLGIAIDISTNSITSFLTHEDCYRINKIAELGYCNGEQSKKFFIFQLTDGSISNTLDIYIASPAINPTGTMMASIEYTMPQLDYRRYINIINLDSKQSMFRLIFDEFDGSVVGNASIDGSIRYLAATLGPPGVINIWDLEYGMIIRTLQVSGEEITGLAFSPDQNTFASIDTLGILRLWNIEKGVQTGAFSFEEAIGPLLFSLDGLRIATQSSLSDVTQIMEIDLQSGHIETKTKSPVHAINEYDPFSPVFFYLPNNHLFTWDNILKGDHTDTTVMDLTSNEVIFEFQNSGGQLESDSAVSISISYDGQYLAAGLWNGNIQIWDIADHNLIRTIKIPQNYVCGGDGGPPRELRNAFFSPQTNLLVGVDGVISLFNIDTGEVIRTLDACCQAAFTPDGRYLVTTEYGAIRVWGL